jgi:hypothetical protein
VSIVIRNAYVHGGAQSRFTGVAEENEAMTLILSSRGVDMSGSSVAPKSCRDAGLLGSTRAIPLARQRAELRPSLRTSSIGVESVFSR